MQQPHQPSTTAAAIMKSKPVLLASSSGTNAASGAPIITPVSVLTCKNPSDGSEYQTRAADNVRLTINPVWSYSLLGVAIPAQRLFDHVPIHPALIRHWLRSEQSGGLVFPAPMLDMESLEPKVHIQKTRTPSGLPSSTLVIYVDIHLHLFRRAMPATTALPPFDPAVWRADSYAMWRYMHAEFAVMLEEEIEYAGDATRAVFPPAQEDQCALFRRMMRAHFEDCGLVFGKVWHDFGLGALVEDADDHQNNTKHTFMRGMLLELFLAYHAQSAPPPLPLPPCCNAATVDPGQHICAQCLEFKLGRGLMMRCPCKTVGGGDVV